MFPVNIPLIDTVMFCNDEWKMAHGQALMIVLGYVGDTTFLHMMRALY